MTMQEIQHYKQCNKQTIVAWCYEIDVLSWEKRRKNTKYQN
jgi:hypothetical protein